MTQDLLFLGALSSRQLEDAQVGLVGVPYDGAITYRGGARFGPNAIRRASDSIESYCPKLGRDLEDMKYADLGDLDLAVDGEGGEALMRHLRAQLDRLPPSLPLIAMGGDHLVAYPFLERALEAHPALQILHIDAHGDLREDWEGEPFNHATVLRRALDRMALPSKIHQWGIRSGLREEFELVRDDPRIEFHAPSPAPVHALLQAWSDSQVPVYLTLDVDGIDPSDIPGTGTPEADGLRYGEVERVLGMLASVNLVGADVVELTPELDPTGRSEVAVARLIRTLLLALAKDPKGR